LLYWYKSTNTDAAALLAPVNQEGIHILIDLNGHTSGMKLFFFEGMKLFFFEGIHILIDLNGHTSGMKLFFF
jgi:predicted O-linked N-acetylglucosamine transferase (SPINDLY family)